MNTEEIPIDDEETYKHFQEGRAVSKFRYESAGTQQWKKLYKPTTKEFFLVKARMEKRVFKSSLSYRYIECSTNHRERP